VEERKLSFQAAPQPIREVVSVPTQGDLEPDSDGENQEVE
jgi:hypothetical protein